MTETKWTPGPWENQDEDAFADMPFIRIGVGNRTLCEVFPPVDAEEIDDETDANANLIAAAPDLYAATDWVDKIKGFTFSNGELKLPAPESIPIEFPTTLFDLSNKRCDEMVFDIPLKGAEIRAMIDARRKARGE